MSRVTIKKRVVVSVLAAAMGLVAMASANATAGAAQTGGRRLLSDDEFPALGLSESHPPASALGVPPKARATKRVGARRTLSGVNGWNVFAGFAECQLFAPRTITIYPASATGTNTKAGVLDWQMVYWQPYSFEYTANGTLTKTAIGPMLHSAWMSDAPSAINANNWKADDGSTYPYGRNFTLYSTTTRFSIYNLFLIFDWNSQTWNSDYEYSVTRC